MADQLGWARFHLGDGHAESGEPVLPAEVLHWMKEPTAQLRGSTLGDAFGICRFLRDLDGVRTVGHGGSANGQFAKLLTVPEQPPSKAGYPVWHGPGPLPWSRDPGPRPFAAAIRDTVPGCGG